MKSSKIFNLNSSDGFVTNSPMNSQVSYDIVNMIERGPQVQYMEISVLYAQIANSFYLITTHNNVIYIGGASYSLGLGNYNINTMLAALRLLLTGYTIAYDSQVGKITFSNAAAFSISASLSSIGRILGLDRNSDMVATMNTSGAYVLVCTNLISFFPQARLNLVIPEFKVRNINTHSQSTEPLIASIPNSANSKGMILYSNPDIKFFLSPSELNIFTVMLKDDSGRLMDFNGQAWFLVLHLETTYNHILPSQMTFSDAVRENKKRAYDLIDQIGIEESLDGEFDPLV